MLTSRRAELGLRRAFLLALTGAVLTGCSATLPVEQRMSLPGLPERVELTEVPFYSQDDHQCGPASLAMALNWAGARTTPERLVPQIYLPARHGSLQPELLVATRRLGYLGYVLEPGLDSVLLELAAGHPVVVMQNRGLGWYPVWHYAVAVGFDAGHQEVILRSGRQKRHVVSLRVFERTWRRAEYWALVVLPPGEMPPTARESPYIQAVLGLEQLGHWRAAALAYRAAVARWPQSLSARMGLGNSLYATGDLAGAQQAYRQATLDHPTAGVAFNNLAQTLADQGHWQEAEQAAQRAVSLGGPLLASYKETLRAILARSSQ